MHHVKLPAVCCHDSHVTAIDYERPHCLRKPSVGTQTYRQPFTRRPSMLTHFRCLSIALLIVALLLSILSPSLTFARDKAPANPLQSEVVRKKSRQEQEIFQR